LREDTSLELLVIGGPGVDGILWGYRKGHHGVWGYYVTEDRFAVLAATASELRTGYSTGRIIV
jgi:hypothetical protein